MKSTGHDYDKIRFIKRVRAVIEDYFELAAKLSAIKDGKKANMITTMESYILKTIIYCDNKFTKPKEDRIIMCMICRYWLLTKQIGAIQKNKKSPTLTQILSSDPKGK